ncbi:peptide-methionine (S)-S-oxide reductase MsrA [Oenococcus alcoholitolerans]|uniref:peptide-methionine (S)-S-oxide reductase MsrA n=1 Tax=Oenococcus alcoholitolerans TaxID=931074 RepID=UPI003F6E8CCF
MDNKNSQQERVLRTIYNLMLDPATTEWERFLLKKTKDRIEGGDDLKRSLQDLEFSLRPLNVRDSLTPDVADFYSELFSGKIYSGQGSSLTSPQLSSKRSSFGIDDKFVERAVFAGGCFWCMVEPFEEQPGILSVLSGYTGGKFQKPTYQQVVGGLTDQVEAVEIFFDRRLIAYEQLLELYWQITDPTDEFGQINDRGAHYRPVIFYTSNTQYQLAENSKQKLAESGAYTDPIVTEIKPATDFWPAENFHQDFYKKNPEKYKLLKRDRRQYLKFLHFSQRVKKITKKVIK